jgi:flagellar basal-body rod protein FlgC
MIRLRLWRVLALMTWVGGCAGSSARPASVTLLDRADPTAAELITYLPLQHVPVATIDGGETRIQATAQCRQALIQFMELNHLRMEICAANIANVNTTRDVDGKPIPYRRRFIAITSSGAAETRVDDSPYPRRYCPGHTDADAAGFVQYPNVDLAAEYVTCQEACRNYEFARTILQRWDPAVVITSPPTPS